METSLRTATENVKVGWRDWSPRAVLVAVLLVVCGYYGNLAKDSYMDDFRAFYVASAAVRAGLDPYVNHVDRDEVRFEDGLWVKADSRYLYPPTALFFLEPLSRVPYKWSKTAFGTLMALTMVGVLWWLVGKFTRYSGMPVVLLALFLTLPMFMNIDNGQVDCAILALVLAAFALEDGWLAGVLLGVAVAVKFAPVLLVVWFVGKRRWRTVGWCAGICAALGAAAYGRWGLWPFREFVTHVVRHVDLNSLGEVLHDFTTVTKIGNTVLVTADGVFSYQHDIGGYLQNPLRLLGPAAGATGWLVMAGFTVWLFGTRRGRALSAERSFFLFLAVALLANRLLWTMGLVACFPLTVLLVDESKTPNRAAVLLLVPLLLTKQIVGNFNFTVWLVMAAWLLWEAGWFGGRGTVEAEAAV